MIQVDLDTGQEVQQPAISPDGSRVVFVAHDARGQHLATRRLDQTRTSALPETEGAMRPFFSPDGRSVGFFAGGKLKRVALDGGAPVVLADAEYPGGGMWGDDGTIAAVLGQWTTSIVYRIPSVGGSPNRGPLAARPMSSMPLRISCRAAGGCSLPAGHGTQATTTRCGLRVPASWTRRNCFRMQAAPATWTATWCFTGKASSLRRPSMPNV